MKEEGRKGRKKEGENINGSKEGNKFKVKVVDRGGIGGRERDGVRGKVFPQGRGRVWLYPPGGKGSV